MIYVISMEILGPNRIRLSRRTPQGAGSDWGQLHSQANCSLTHQCFSHSVQDVKCFNSETDVFPLTINPDTWLFSTPRHIFVI